MIVILAVALIVVGPDKLPELARSLAKGVNELKKTMNQVKDSLNEETQVVSSVQRDLQQTAGQVKTQLLEEGIKSPNLWKQEGEKTSDQDESGEGEVVEAETRPLRSWEEEGDVTPARQNDSEEDSKEEPEALADDVEDAPEESSEESEVAENDDTSATRPTPAA